MNWLEVREELRASVKSGLDRDPRALADEGGVVAEPFRAEGFSLLVEETARRDPALAFDLGHAILARESGLSPGEAWPIAYPRTNALLYRSPRFHPPSSVAGESVQGFPGARIEWRPAATETISATAAASAASRFESRALFWTAWLAGMLAGMAEETRRYSRERVQGGRTIGDWSEHRLNLGRLESEILSAGAWLEALRSDRGRLTRELPSLLDLLAHRSEEWASELVSLWGGAGYMREYPLADRYAALIGLVPPLRADRADR